jgi:hypothetical protein
VHSPHGVIETLRYIGGKFNFPEYSATGIHNADCDFGAADVYCASQQLHF